MKEEFLQKYYKVLCAGDFPSFLLPYLNTKEMRRLQTIGQFCGCDYSIYTPLFFYSRYDHSLATALMAWHFTKDRAQTLCALFHDNGTPCFSHCIDYLLGDYEKQTSSEKEVDMILSESREIRKLLIRDGISLEAIKDFGRYSIVENEKPKICVDRLDGVLHTVLIWLHTHTLEQVEEVYRDLTVLTNEQGESEIGFCHREQAERFFAMVYRYSMELQSNEDKFVMQYIADSLKVLLKENLLKIEQLYQVPEKTIVELLEYYIPSWKTFCALHEIVRSDEKPNGYFVSVKVKKRYVLPLCQNGEKPVRLDRISSYCQTYLEKYFQFEDAPIAYAPGIEKILIR